LHISSSICQRPISAIFLDQEAWENRWFGIPSPRPEVHRYGCPETGKPGAIWESCILNRVH